MLYNTSIIDYFSSNEWMFFDVAKINVKGGDGGAGCMAMQREFRIAFGGPAGGNGGDGGSVYLICDKRLNTLGMLRRRVHHRGKDGTNGRGDSRHGIKAPNVYVPVPPGLHCCQVISVQSFSYYRHSSITSRYHCAGWQRSFGRGAEHGRTDLVGGARRRRRSWQRALQDRTHECPCVR